MRKIILSLAIVISLGIFYITPAMAREISPLSNTSLPIEHTILSYSKLKALVAAGQLDRAKTEIQFYLQYHANDADATALLASVYYKQGDYETAARIAGYALQANPSSLDTALLLVRSQSANKDYSAVIATTTQQLKLHPQNQDLENLKTQAEELLQKKTIASQNSSPSTNDNNVTTQQVTNPSVTSNVKTIKQNPEITYEGLNQEFNRGHISKVKQLAIAYLQKNPTDGDVRFLLARVYLAEKNPVAAKKELREILAQTPSYAEVRMLLINLEVGDKEYDLALRDIAVGLKQQPYDTALLMKEAEIYYTTGQYQFAGPLLKNLQEQDPHNKDARDMLNDLIDESPRDGIGPNQLGIYQTMQNASDLHQMWDYTTIYYARDTSHGQIIANINYASRFQQEAFQGEIQAYPTINKYAYLFLDLGYANNPVLFPNYTAGAEAYFTIPKFIDPSIGITYNSVNGPKYYDVFTGSLSRYLGDVWVSVRPYYYAPSSGSPSILYTATVRDYLNDAGDCFIGITVATGHSPDLYDLQSIDFVVIRNSSAAVNVEFPIFHHRFVVDLGMGYEQDQYPNGLVRNLLGGTVGLRARY